METGVEWIAIIKLGVDNRGDDGIFLYWNQGKGKGEGKVDLYSA